jgi:two-component system response regulator NreC
MMPPFYGSVCRSGGADLVVPSAQRCDVPGGPTLDRIGNVVPLASPAVEAATPVQPIRFQLMDGVESSPQARTFTVVIADDHAVVRDGVKTLLERSGREFQVVAEAADVPSVVVAVREHQPDLLILDLSMPGGSSLSALPACFAAHPSLAVAILTMHEDPAYAREAIRAGARSYVVKEAEPSELLQAFRAAVTGGSYVHPRLGALLAAADQEEDPDGVALSEREREVVRLIALGHTNPQIAERLHVAERTVKTYRARAVEKLGFSARAEITAYARRTGLTD